MSATRLASSAQREEIPLELVSTPPQLFDPATLFSDSKEEFKDSAIIAVFDPDELSFELLTVSAMLKRPDQHLSRTHH